MKIKIHSALLLGLLALLSTLNSQLSTFAQGTSFTYQGRLNDGLNPANGRYDFQFQVFDTPTVGTGSSYGSPNPNTATNVLVNNGLFTLVLDFGTGVFTGLDRWLQIGARTNGAGTFGALSPRQRLTPTPYAIYAANAAQIGGQSSTAFVAKAGDQMAGALTLPANGLVVGGVGGNQLVATDGNIGIGTASPGALLNVASTGPLPVLIQNSSTTGTWLALRNTAGGGDWSLISSGSGNGEGAGNLLFNNGPTRMVLNGSGMLGLGSTVPGQALQVGDQSIIGSQGMIRLGSRTLTGAGVMRTWDIGVPQTGDDSSGIGYSFVIVDQTHGTTPQFMIKYDSGNVGIGTTNPSAQLHIATSGGDGNPAAWLSQLNSDYARLRFTQVGGYNTRWDFGATSNSFTIYSGLYGKSFITMDTNGVHTPAGLVIETRTGSDPSPAVPGQIWLRTDLP